MNFLYDFHTFLTFHNIKSTTNKLNLFIISFQSQWI